MRMPHLSKKILGLIIVVMAVLGTATYLMRPRVVDVETGRARRGPLRVTVDEDGRTRVRDRFVITAPVTGRLQRLVVREGMTIRPGEVVAWIAPLPLDASARRQAEARLESARALAAEAAVRVRQTREAAEQASRIAKRSEVLLAAGGISPVSHDDAMLESRARDDERTAAESRARAADAEVRAAQAALLAVGSSRAIETAVRSPARGRVLRVPEASERVVAAGTPILEVGDAAALEVIADVLSTDAVRIRAGQEVEIAEWGGERPLTGSVASVEPAAFTRVSALGVDEQRVNVVIGLDGPVPALGDGFRLEARIVVWQAPDVLTVPTSALFQRGEDDWSVFLVVDGRARQRTVKIGHRTARSVEVIDGLEANDEVVLFPSDQVHDGIRLRSSSRGAGSRT